MAKKTPVTTKPHGRHEFKKPVRKVLEEQACSACCNPGCKQPTRATAFDNQRSINIGTAAHIHAASPGGPRYDSKMTPEERESHENGIWLCRNCGTLVDDDKGGFPVEVLLDWKKRMLAERRNGVVSPAQRITPTVGHTTSTPLAQKNDIARYHEFIGAYPSDKGAIARVQQFNAGHSFDNAIFGELKDLVHRWTAPERAFSNSTVQAALRRLTTAAYGFISYGAFNTWALPKNSERSHVPPEWEDTAPDRFNATVKALNELAEKVNEAHSALIQTARQELGF